jgi:hypothetical protein
MEIIPSMTMDFKKDLSLFDLTNIIVGSVIGADIYIVSRDNCRHARSLFPFGLGYCRRI